MNTSEYINESMSRYIHLSKYSRWLPKQKRRETWEETCDRLIKFWEGRYGYIIDAEVFVELRQFLVERKAMPSMRTLMTAGPALDRDEAAGFNPVVGSTKVLTKEYGYEPIGFLEGKDATVLNYKGEWSSASFKCYGEQDTFDVTLRKNSNTTIVVRCTGNHRWLTTDGVVKHTDELIPGLKGDKVPYSFYKRDVDEDNIDYQLGVAHGIVFADGTSAYSQERIKGYLVRLCGGKNSLLPLLERVGGVTTYPPSFNGDAVVQLYGSFAKTHSLKDLPSVMESEEYLIGFVRGWISCDGSVCKSRGSVTLCMNEAAKVWFEKYSATLGFVVQHVKKQSDITNYGRRTQDSFVLSIDRSCMTKDDILDSSKKDYFVELSSRFSVVSVEATGEKELVWCATVPNTNTFVLEKGLVTGNCAGAGISHIRYFDEIFYLLMCGTGVGFSVEHKYVDQLPVISEDFHKTDTVIRVRDSKIGWAKGLKELIALLYNGDIPTWDLSEVRPAGARLKTFGGRASGPEPLDKLFHKVVEIISKAAGRRLTPLECHDLVCWIAMTVIVGSVRRSACISLSDLWEHAMRKCKMGDWYYIDPQRQLANNSAAYYGRPPVDQFAKEFMSMYTSRSGERGIVNKNALRDQAESCGREYDGDYLLNPLAI